MREAENSPLEPHICGLRPHHGLCGEFFRGEGYSGEFTENMRNVLNRLDSLNPEIRLTSGPDAICERCPNNIDGVCETAEKSCRYDLAVLDLCGLSEGDVLRRNVFRELVREKIILPGRLTEVCGDCRWYGICRSK